MVIRKIRFPNDSSINRKEHILEGDIKNNDQIAINEVQLILAEKRTSLAVLRTGIAVLALPISVLSVLIATSRYYDISGVLPFFIPLAILNFVLIIIGIHLIIRSIIRMRHYDRFVKEIKQKHSVISQFIE